MTDGSLEMMRVQRRESLTQTWRTMADGIPWMLKIDEELPPHKGEMAWTNSQVKNSMILGCEGKEAAGRSLHLLQGLEY